MQPGTSTAGARPRPRLFTLVARCLFNPPRAESEARPGSAPLPRAPFEMPAERAGLCLSGGSQEGQEHGEVVLLSPGPLAGQGLSYPALGNGRKSLTDAIREFKDSARKAPPRSSLGRDERVCKAVRGHHSHSVYLNFQYPQGAQILFSGPHGLQEALKSPGPL